MRGFKVVARHSSLGEMSRTISEGEYENLKKSQKFKIISVEEINNYVEPGFLLSKHPIGAIL